MSDFEISGGDAFHELAGDLTSMADEVREALDSAVQKTAFQVERSAKQNAPVDTGTLRASLRTVQTGTAEYAVGTNVEYAPAVEYGTDPHVITPDGDFLYFEGRGGHLIRKRSVNHPGTPAQPFLRPALNEHESDLEANIAAAIRDLADREF